MGDASNVLGHGRGTGAVDHFVRDTAECLAAPGHRSRTLLKRAGGTLTLFAFDKGQSLSEHTAPFDAVSHVLEGEADITIAGTVHHVSAGEMVLMPANQPHAVNARTRFKMLLTMVRSI